jgi:glycosyltransferase involved in cell wall biosynthesis
MPLVSVVMPSYNHEEFIAESIESVLGQDFDGLELIIVDDASTDASRYIIKEYAEDARVSIILHETNCGIAKTFNDGIAAAKGKFVAYIASDDVWMKDKLSKQLAVLESNEDLIVYAEAEVIDESGQPVGLTYGEGAGVIVSGKKSGDIFMEYLGGGFPAVNGSTLLHKRVNLCGILFDEHLKYLNDVKFFLDLAATYEFHYIAEPLSQYRIHASNTWGFKGPEGEQRLVGYQDEILIREHALRRYPHRMSAEVKATELERLGSLYHALGQNRKALMSFIRAFTSSPFRRSNLQYPRHFFQFTQNVLRREVLERK